MPAANDAFANSAALTFPATISADNTGATTEVGEPISTVNDSISATLWWTFTATDTGLAKLDIAQADYGLYAYRQAGAGFAGLVRVNESYNNAPGGSTTEAIFFVCKGLVYYVQVGTYPGGTPGPFTLTTAFKTRAITTGWVTSGWIQSGAPGHGDTSSEPTVLEYPDTPTLAFDDVLIPMNHNTPYSIGRIGTDLYHFGANPTGVRGDGTATGYTSSTYAAPQKVPGLPAIAHYTGRNGGVYAWTSGGDLYYWGAAAGAGDGSVTSRLSPVLSKTSVDLADFDANAGLCHTTDGKLWFTGNLPHFGAGSIINTTTWTDITGPWAPGADVASLGICYGFISIWVVLTNGQVWYRGNNHYGEGGLGDTAERASWTNTGHTAAQIVGGYSEAYWIDGSGNVSYTGRNQAGTSFLPGGPVFSTPTALSWLPAVQRLTPVGYDATTGGAAFCLNGEVWCWGGQSGNSQQWSVENQQYQYSTPLGTYTGTDWIVGGNTYAPQDPRKLAFPSDWTVQDYVAGEHGCALKVLVGGVPVRRRAFAQVVG